MAVNIISLYFHTQKDSPSTTFVYTTSFITEKPFIGIGFIERKCWPAAPHKQALKSLARNEGGLASLFLSIISSRAIIFRTEMYRESNMAFVGYTNT